MASDHKGQRPITDLMSTCADSCGRSMAHRHSEAGQEDMHSTEIAYSGPTMSPQISPGFSGSWPDGPLVEWPVEVLERYFDAWEAVVMAEGRAQ